MRYKFPAHPPVPVPGLAAARPYSPQRLCPDEVLPECTSKRCEAGLAEGWQYHLYAKGGEEAARQGQERAEKKQPTAKKVAKVDASKDG